MEVESASRPNRWSGVVVVYLDEDGEALTARGAHFGPFGAGIVEVPESHAAHHLLADGYPTDGSPQYGAVCAQSGWRICLVLDDGILAVVAFGNVNGTAVTLDGPAVSEGSITLPAAGATPSSGSTVQAGRSQPQS
jgi:hypothetical protein